MLDWPLPSRGELGGLVNCDLDRFAIGPNCKARKTLAWALRVRLRVLQGTRGGGCCGSGMRMVREGACICHPTDAACEESLWLSVCAHLQASWAPTCCVLVQPGQQYCLCVGNTSSMCGLGSQLPDMQIVRQV